MFNLVFQLSSVFQIEVSLLFIKIHAPLYPFLCLLGKKPLNSAVFPSMNIFRMKEKARTKRVFLSFPQFVQKKWKTKENDENALVKTHEKVEADVEILLSQPRRTHVRKAGFACGPQSPVERSLMR